MKKINKEWLRGKKVVIVGASSGIGKHLAFNLILKYNCYIIAISNNKKEMEAFYEKMEEYCNNMEYHIFDAKKEKDWQIFSDGLWQSESKIDVVINCVGEFPKMSSIDTHQQKDIEYSMTANFYSSVFSVRYLLPLLKLSPSPAIINIGCITAQMSIKGTGAYSASKSALTSYTEVLSQELENFYVAIVLLGVVKSEFYKNQDKTVQENILKYAISPNTACNKIISAMTKKKSRIVVGKYAKFADYAFRIFPVKAKRLLKYVSSRKAKNK